jgi:hypothetical protein
MTEFQRPIETWIGVVWLRAMDEAALLHKRSFEHPIQQHGGKRIRKLLKCIA